MKSEKYIAITASLLLLASLPASAAEMAVLRNGFSIRNEHHELRDNVTRIYLTDAQDNYLDIPTADILRFEEVELPPAQALQAAPTVPANTIDAVVSAASMRNNIDPDLITSVIRAESAFNSNAVSQKGALGLMQLMPGTAASLGVRNTMDPADNVEGGTRYLRDLLDRYHNDLLKTLAAYNAGPQRVEQYKGVPPYRETRAYITRIVTDFNRKKVAQRNKLSEAVAKRPVSPKNSSAPADKTTPAATSRQQASILDNGR